MSSLLNSRLRLRGSLVWRMRDFPRGTYELSLLPDFNKHVTCKLWSDKQVSIIALFYLMICY